MQVNTGRSRVIRMYAKQNKNKKLWLLATCVNSTTDLQIRSATLPVKFVSKFRFRKLAFSFVDFRLVRFTGALEITIWSLFGHTTLVR